MNILNGAVALDPIAELLGDWSKGINVYSALLRIVLIIVRLSSGASAQASAIRRGLGRLFLFRSLQLSQ